MNYTVQISPDALMAAEEAYLWIHARSPANSARWYTRLMAAIDSLGTNPQRCGLAPESDAFPVEPRQFLYGKRRGIYRILFTIERDTVRIHHIRHSAQNLLTGPESPGEGDQ